MNAEKLEKIRRLAEDKRGDPATRAVAQAVYKRYAKPKEENIADFVNRARAPRTVHGLRRDPTYEYHLYCNLSDWDKTKAGNPTYMVLHKDVYHRIVLFKHKRGHSWGWMRINTYNDQTEFSGRFDSITEAQGDAWRSLMMS